MENARLLEKKEFAEFAPAAEYAEKYVASYRKSLVESSENTAVIFDISKTEIRSDGGEFCKAVETLSADWSVITVSIYCAW